jgi:hypothetical protein
MGAYSASLTGDGAHDFGASIAVTGLAAKLTVAGAGVTYQSATQPKRIMHAGWIGFAWVDAVTPPDRDMIQFKYLEFERENWSNLPLPSCRWLVWHCSPGSTILVGVSW